MSATPIAHPPASAALGAPVKGSVLVAIVVLLASALPPILILPHDRVSADTTLLLLAWMPLGMVGVWVIDQGRLPRLGWAAIAASITPLVVMGWLLLTSDDPGDHGNVLATLGGAGPWWLLPVLLPGLSLIGPRARSVARWRFWLLLTAAAGASVSVLAWALAPAQVYGPTLAASVIVVACVVAATCLTVTPRPVDEPLLDIALIVGVLAVGLLTGLAVHAVTAHERVYAAGAVGVFAGGLATIMAVPGAWWVRRSVLARRYGAGVLSPQDVTAITAGLDTHSDPRLLLPRAAELVRAASGAAAAEIVLDSVEERPGWTDIPLAVGQDPVGTLSVQGRHREGLEPRQERVVSQLAPTIAVVARAVTLGVETEHARQDVSTRQEAERARIMRDLHDDLGPVLAGMSMRVNAALQTDPSDTLQALASDLETCRADLRRIVSGLAPRAVTTDGVAVAIQRLVASFATDSGPAVTLAGPVPDGVAGDAAVTAYRTVAEGVTNAVRHARARRVSVSLTRHAEDLRIVVADDGTVTGELVRGVGLTSLAARAAELGGALVLDRTAGSGTRLVVDLPGSFR